MDINWEDTSNYPLAMFLCVVGAAVGFCMVYAVAYLAGATRSDEPNRFEIPVQQARYMREVRERNLRDIAAAAGRRYRFVEDDGYRFGGRGEWVR